MNDALAAHLLAFWNEYCRRTGTEVLEIAACHHMNNEISIEHKMVAQRLALLWDTFSVQPLDAAHFPPATENPPTQESLL